MSKKDDDKEVKEKEKQKSKDTGGKGRGRKNQRATYKQALVAGVHLRNKLRRVRRHILRMGAHDDEGDLYGFWYDQFAVKRFIELGGKPEQLRRRVDTKG